jgi:microcystin degradation protein MlrC
MRIAIGQLWQETNTFNPRPTTRQDFEPLGIFRGTELVERMADTNELGGFIQSLRTWPEQPEIAGLVRLAAWPGGPATHETFDWLRRQILEAVRAAGPVDGVLLALHGSLVADGTPDVEGQVLGDVREIIGPDVPIVATLDLHANVTERIVRAADALVVFHTVPHVDVFETGQRGAAVLRRILFENVQPVTAFQKIPLVVPAERANTQDPSSVSHDFKQHLAAWEQRPRILAAGLTTVQPWLDIPELGSAALVVTDGEAELAESTCSNLAADLWHKRHDYFTELVSVERAVREAYDNPAGLVVLGDGADATTSGAPGDSTWILQELLHYDWPRPVLLTMVAPQVVEEARRRGIGHELTTTIGSTGDCFGRPIEVTAHVAGLFDARFVMSGHLARNLAVDMGTAAVLRLGNIHIVLTSRTGPHFAPELFQAAGLDPFGAGVLVAKSPCGFRAAYQPYAVKILMVRAPGCAPSDFWRYPYRRIPHPLWPWDQIDPWTPQPLIDRKPLNG